MTVSRRSIEISTLRSIGRSTEGYETRASPSDVRIGLESPSTLVDPHRPVAEVVANERRPNPSRRRRVSRGDADSGRTMPCRRLFAEDDESQDDVPDEQDDHGYDDEQVHPCWYSPPPAPKEVSSAWVHRTMPVTPQGSRESYEEFLDSGPRGWI